ncbi:MAG: DUF29 domain-containing protein [Acidobacteriota bacterium]
MKKIETDDELQVGRVRSQGMGVNWARLSAESHYQVAVEIERALLQGDADEAEAGIKELIDALGRSEKRALKSQLIRLMAHIIKWKTQPERRSYGWVATIYNAREEIADIQAETPSLTDDVIKKMWDGCLRAATREAEGEMNQESAVSPVSWQEVFDDECEVK